LYVTIITGTRSNSRSSSSCSRALACCARFRSVMSASTTTAPACSPRTMNGAALISTHFSPVGLRMRTSKPRCVSAYRAALIAGRSSSGTGLPSPVSHS
jgi:hypothetical protein